MGKRRWVAFLLILALVVSVAGCGAKTEPVKENKADNKAQAPKSPKIALLMPSLAGNVYVSLTYGFLDEAKKMGIEQPIVLAAGGYDKLDVQVKQVEDMIAAGVDAIVIMPLSADGMIPVIDRAIDKGITLLEMGNITNSKKVKARVRSNQLDIGKRLGKAIAESLKGKGNVVMFNGPTGASWSQLETDGFKSVMKDYPDIKILAEKWTVYDAGVAMNTMNDLLQAFPKIDYIYTSYDTYAEGAARALEAAGKKGKIKMATASLSPATLQMLKDETLEYVVGTGMAAEGRLALQTVLKMIKGEQVPAEQWAPLTDYWSKDIKANPNLDTTKEYYPDGWTVPK